MATRGLPCSWRSLYGSQVRTAARPGLVSVLISSNASSAHSALSRPRCMWYDVSAQALWSFTRVSVKMEAPLAAMRISWCSAVGQPTTRQQGPSPNRSSTACTFAMFVSNTCSTAPTSSAKRAATGSAVVPRSTSSPVCPAKAISTRVTKRPPSDRSWYATTRPSVRSTCMALAMLRRARASSTSGASLPIDLKTWARAEAPSLSFPAERSISSREEDPRSVRSCGVSVFRTSVTGANPVTMRDTGATTTFSPVSSAHLVAMDILSLPTGTQIPSLGQMSIPRASTASYSNPSSPAYPAAHIQLADTLMSEVSMM
mmetsp:Transcript_39813/g.71321  ORF Transcript_39813/g.71321 Transcript_39813/m.71321 type:complete len:315 (+) Transcript_39813:916-1860(+)